MAIGLASLLVFVLAGTAGAVPPFAAFWADGIRDYLEIPIYEDARGIYRVDDWEYTASEFSVRPIT
jgi:hypothetical protein